MKKTLVSLFVILTVSLAASNFVDARPWGRGGGMMGPGGIGCDMWDGGAHGGQVDEATIKAREKFFAETVDLRRKLAVKQAEFEALMNHENPDEKKAARLAGEIFDLRMEKRQKAIDSGLKTGCGNCGMGRNKGPGMMRGPMQGGGVPATK